MANILGVNCDLEVEHTAGGRAKITSIFKPDGGAKKVATVNDQSMFDLEDYCKEFSGESCDESKNACDIFADLPAILCEMIEGSYELAAAYSKGRKAEAGESKGGLAAVYCRSKAFKDLIVEVDINEIVPDPDRLRVELRDAKGKQVELSNEMINQHVNKVTTKILEDHYNFLIDSDVRYGDGRAVEKTKLFFIRKYKGDFDSGGRIYGGLQNKPKTERLGLTIAGSKVGSLDISQLHPMLILRLVHGVEKERLGMLTEGLDDAYVMPDYKELPRGVHKKIINALFNASSEDSAVRALMSTHWWYDDETGKLKVEIYKGKKRRKGQCVFLESPKKSAIKYVESFKRHHPMYGEAIGRGLGVALQAIDGTLIERVIEVANGFKVPVIPVHDEFIVREEDRQLIEMALERVFRESFAEKGKFGTLGAKWTNSTGEEEMVKIDLSIEA
jgi:hypothetical protein